MLMGANCRVDSYDLSICAFAEFERSMIRTRVRATLKRVHCPAGPSLGLIVNVIVLWNTIYMDAALQQLRSEGFEVRDDDVARLSPLGHEHINMLGRYAFSLPDKIARGELRPLRNPNLVLEDA